MQPRALYNLLRMNAEEDPSLEVPAWKIADYRQMKMEELLDIDPDRFCDLADQVDTPEELTGFFTLDDADPEQEDQIYLRVFEMWRRLLPERQTLSIFCDELDHQITAYDRGEGIDLPDRLLQLQEMLDDSVDEGADPKELFSDLETYFANDLESFLYDYIVEQIDDGNEVYASELIDAFSPYVDDERYFYLLQIRLWALDDPDHAQSGLEALLEGEPEVDLSLEILDLLARAGDRELFLQLAKETLLLIENEEQFLELLDLCVHYYRSLDYDEKEAAIDRLIHSREERESDAPFSANDPDVQSLITIIG